MYLKEAYIQNYKSIVDETVTFDEGLNVFIGQNGSGKSNLLAYLRQYFNFMTLSKPEEIESGITEEIFIIAPQVADLERSTYEIVIKRVPDDEDRSFGISRTSGVKNHVAVQTSITINRRGISGSVKTFAHSNLKYLTDAFEINEELPDLVSNVGNLHISYDIPDNTKFVEQPVTFDVNYGDHEFGFSIAQAVFSNRNLYRKNDIVSQETCLQTLQETIKENRIIEILQRLTLIEDLRINPNITVYNIEKRTVINNILLQYKINDEWVPWNYLSDGTKRLFYLVTECILAEGLVLIEEPELGVHPHQLFKLMDFIKEQSQTKQIVVATHSPIVLDALAPDELDKITIVKLENGKSKFHKLTEAQKEKARDYMSEVGELSYYWMHSDLEA